MADLLSSLESVLARSIGISAKLHTYLSRIDEHMNRAAREREERGVKHTRGIGIVQREPKPEPLPLVPNLDPALFDMSWNFPILSDIGIPETFVPNPPVNTTDSSMQIQLPEELTADWPFGTNEAFDFLGNW